MELTSSEIMAGFAVMAAVIGTLWRLIGLWAKKEKARLDHYQLLEQKRLENCERLHLEQSETIISITGDYRELKGRMDGVESLSRNVLQRLDELQT